MSRTLLFLLIYQCLLHSQSCDWPRSIFTFISFFLKAAHNLRPGSVAADCAVTADCAFTISVLYTTVDCGLQTVQYCGHVLQRTAQQLLRTAARYLYLYKSQACWVACSLRLDFFCSLTVQRIQVIAHQFTSPFPLFHSKLSS